MLPLSNSAVSRETDAEISRDVNDYRRLFSLYANKVRLIGLLQNRAQRGDKIRPGAKVLKEVVSGIDSLNRQISGILRRFVDDIDKSRNLETSILRRVISTHPALGMPITNGQGISEGRQAEFAAFISNFEMHLRNLMNFLATEDGFIRRINKKLKDTKEIPNELRVPFLNVLFDERTHIHLAHEEAKQFIRVMESEHDSSQAAAHARVLYTPRVIDVTGKDRIRFEQFYQKAQAQFPEDELDPPETLFAALNDRTTSDGVGYSSHLLAVEYGGQIIGGAFFDYVMVEGYLPLNGGLVELKKPFSFGVVWWILLSKQILDQNGNDVTGRIHAQSMGLLKPAIERTLRQSHSILGLGGPTLKGVFGEVYNPAYMASVNSSAPGSFSPDEMFRAHALSVMWMRYFGMRPAFQDYVQMLNFDEEQFERAQKRRANRLQKAGENNPQKLAVEKTLLATEREFVNYCHLMYYPASADWKARGIPKKDLLAVIYAFTAIANEWPHKYLRKLESYRRMYQAIAEGAKYFGTEDDAAAFRAQMRQVTQGVR